MADDVVVCDQTWIPDDQEQVEDRAHRVSRNHNVTVWNLASLGTIDEAVAVTNAAREDAIFSILEGQRGVAYVKEILSKLKDAGAAWTHIEAVMLFVLVSAWITAIMLFTLFFKTITTS